MKARPHSKPLPDLLIEKVGKDKMRYLGPMPLKVKVPLGDSNKLEEIQYSTVSLTIFGMLFLIREIYNKSGEKVVEYSNL